MTVFFACLGFVAKLCESITSNKITSLTKDLSKRAIICRIGAKIDNERGAKNSKRVNESMSELTTAFYGEYVRRMLVCIDEMTTEMRENANGKEYFLDIFHASSSVIADIFEACGIDLPDYVRILYYNDYMGDESIGRAAIEKIELAWQADPSKFRVDKKQNRLIYKMKAGKAHGFNRGRCQKVIQRVRRQKEAMEFCNGLLSKPNRKDMSSPSIS